MGFGKNILDMLTIGIFTYLFLAFVNAIGISLFEGMFDGILGMFVWAIVVFLEISVARL